MSVEDTKLAKPVAVVDLWDLDDRVSHLENLIDRFTDAIERLEKITERFLEFLQQQRARTKEQNEGNRGRCKRKDRPL